MNPNGGETQPKFEVPQTNTQETGNESVEKPVVSSPESSPQRQPVQVTAQIVNDLAQPGQSIVPTGDSSDELSVKDSKEIESIDKEWVDKAKKIIAQTQEDPFEQKRAMSKVKADYIKKRFNKTIKTDDLINK
jgi:hypothetical protein